MKQIKTVIAGLTMLFSSWAFAEPVNINTASAMELAEVLNGVGQSRAEAIVQFREANGPFMSAEQLLQVKGIGEKVLQKNLENIVIKSDQ